MFSVFKGKKIVVALTGSIACYKVCELVRDLQRLGADICVAMSDNARKFVGPITFEALSQNKVLIDLFDSELDHIEFARDADLFLLAPATANIIGKCANGIADDVISTLFVSMQCPVLMVPAMHEGMWQNGIVQDNALKLRSFGVNFLGPVEGDLASGDYGKGRFVDNSKIIDEAQSILTKKDLTAKKVLITVGPTYEPIDSVRYISNRSSGKMGQELARAFYMRGAEVSVVSSLDKEDFVDGVDFHKVETAADMLKSVEDRIDDMDIFISNAAVADLRPKNPSATKLKKKNLSVLELELNEDILASVSTKYPDKCMVGFALGDAVEKRKMKDLDLCIAVTTDAFGVDRIHGQIYSKNGQKLDFDYSKIDLANQLADFCL